MVPSGWEIQNLEKIAAITSGGTPSRKKPEYWDGDIPWITTAEVQFCTITDSTEKITLNGLENSSAKLFEPGTLLIAMYGQGKTRGQVAKLGITACTNQACAAIILEKNNDSEFYFQYLSNQYETLRNLSNDGSQKNLSSGIIKSFPVHVPPLTEQIKIAKILSTWDKAIETTEKLISNSQAQKRALMQQLLTGKKRLLDVNGERFSGKWEKVLLGNVSDMNSGGTPLSSKPEYYGNDILWVSIADMTSQGKYIFDTDKKLTLLGLENSSAKIFPKNTVLYAMYASIGECSIAMKELSTSQAILGIRAHPSLNYKFLYFLLNSMKEKVKLQGQQGTQSNLNAAMVKAFKIPLPDLKEQITIANVLSHSDQEIELLEKKLEYLKHEKKALMQQLLTGKRRVTIN